MPDHDNTRGQTELEHATIVKQLLCAIVLIVFTDVSDRLSYEAPDKDGDNLIQSEAKDQNGEIGFNRLSDSFAHISADFWSALQIHFNMYLSRRCCAQ